MAISRNKLIANIIRKKLYEEVEQILLISKQGFDVYAQVEFPEIKFVLIELLEQELNINPRAFKIAKHIEDLEFDNSANNDDDTIFIPTVLVADLPSSIGLGLVQYKIKQPDHLIGNVAQAIEQILDYFSLTFYLDVFDAKKLSRLKQIAKFQGIRALIDAVVQTAYLGGFMGDSEKAQIYLDKTKFTIEDIEGTHNVSIEKSARLFLSHVITYGENSHAFLKSALSYFVICKQGHTTTRASQILSISRTTLQEHLKIAENLGVSEFFDGVIKK